MSLQIIQASEVAAQAWRNGGGVTRELLAWPTPQAWQLRVSLAQVHADGPFSAYPGVRRYFAVVTGAGVALDFGVTESGVGVRPASATMTAQSTPLRFDGALAPACRLLAGPSLDLNLMWRTGEAVMALAYAGLAWQADWQAAGFFARVAGVWRNRTDHHRLAAHSLLWQPEREAEALASAAHPTWEFQPDAAGTADMEESNPVVGWWLGFREFQEAGT